MPISKRARFNDDSILARYFGRSSNYTDIPNHLFNEYNVKKDLEMKTEPVSASV